MYGPPVGGIIIVETEVPVAKVDLSYGPNRGAANKLFACSPDVLRESGSIFWA